MATAAPECAMVLAAGRGERMRPLTDALPKPLLEVGGRSLIEWHLVRLARAGCRRIVVNTAWCAEALEARVHARAPASIELQCLREPAGALDTGGGIRNALPLLGRDPFLVVNGDVWTDADYTALPVRPAGDAHLILVPNPPHHPHGDFALSATGRVDPEGGPRGTYAGIAVLRPELLASCGTGAFPLAPVLRSAAAEGRVGGQWHPGAWSDVGTPERLRAVRRDWANAPLARFADTAHEPEARHGA